MMRHHQSQPALRVYKSVGKHSQLYIDEEINKLVKKQLIVLNKRKEHINKLITDQADNRVKTVNKHKAISHKKQHLAQLTHQSSNIPFEYACKTEQITQYRQQIATNINKMSQIQNSIITNCQQLSTCYSGLCYSSSDVDVSSEKRVYMNILSQEEMVDWQLGVIRGQNSIEGRGNYSVDGDDGVSKTFSQLVMKFCKQHRQLFLPAVTNKQSTQWRRKRQQRIAQWQGMWSLSIQSQSQNSHQQQLSKNLSNSSHSFIQQVSHISHYNRSVIYQLQLSREAEDWLQSLRQHNKIQLHQQSTIMNFLNNDNYIVQVNSHHHNRLLAYQLIARQNLIRQFEEYLYCEIELFLHAIGCSDEQQQAVKSLYQQVKLLVESLKMLRVIYKHQYRQKNNNGQQQSTNQSRYRKLLERIVSMKEDYSKLNRQNTQSSNNIVLLQHQLLQLTKQQECIQAQITLFQQSLQHEQRKIRQSLQELDNAEKASRKDMQQVQLAIAYLSRRGVGSKQRETNPIIESNLYEELIATSQQQQSAKNKDNNIVVNNNHECVCHSMSKEDLSRFLLFKSQAMSNINDCSNSQSSILLKQNMSNNISDKTNSNKYSSSPLFATSTLPLKPLNRTQSSLKLQSPKHNIFSQMSTNFPSPCNKENKSIQTTQNIIHNQSIKRVSKSKPYSQLSKSSTVSSLLIKSTNPKINSFFKKFQTQKSNQHLKLRLL